MWPDHVGPFVTSTSPRSSRALAIKLHTILLKKKACAFPVTEPVHRRFTELDHLLGRGNHSDVIGN